MSTAPKARRSSPLAALVLLCLSSGLWAATRITEGAFVGCLYGNRGGECSFRDADGQVHAIAMPVDEAAGGSGVTWVIDGKAVGYVPMDGGFVVPDHPAFAEDHAIGYNESDHPLRGCRVRLIEKPDATRVLLDTHDCR